METKTTGGKIAVTGNTYPVREKLTSLGGKWDAANKRWVLPAESADAVRAIRVASGGREQLWEPCDRCGSEPVDASGLCSRCRGTKPLVVTELLSDAGEADKLLADPRKFSVDLYFTVQNTPQIESIPDGCREVASGSPYEGGYHVVLSTDGRNLYLTYVHHYDWDTDRNYKIDAENLKQQYKIAVNKLINK